MQMFVQLYKSEAHDLCVGKLLGYVPNSSLLRLVRMFEILQISLLGKSCALLHKN